MTPEEHEKLEARRDELKESIDSLGRLLIVFIVIVVTGLIIELIRPIVSLWNRFDPWVLAEVIGSAGVAIGVAGELAVEWKTHRKEREQLHIDAEIERDAKRVIAELNAQVERERKERIQLENRVGPLRVTGQFSEVLKDKPTGRIEIWHSPIKAIFKFASGIADALGRAGWTVVAVKPTPPPDQRYGLRLDVGGPLAPMYRVIAPIGALSASDGSLPTAYTALCRAITVGISRGIPGRHSFRRIRRKSLRPRPIHSGRRRKLIIVAAQPSLCR